MSRAIVLMLVLSLSLAASALAQPFGPGAPIPPGWNPEPVVQTNQAGTIQYLSGGFDAPERQAMLAATPGFNLRLEFTQGGRAYVGGVLLQIDGGGPARSLNVQNAGPLVMVNLPPGTYRVRGVLEGFAVQQTLTVTLQRTMAVLRF